MFHVDSHVADVRLFDLICDAVRFIAEYGVYFLSLYDFDMRTGKWRYSDGAEKPPAFGIEHMLAAGDGEEGEKAGANAPAEYGKYLDEAKKIASELKDVFSEERLMTTDRSLISFYYYT